MSMDAAKHSSTAGDPKSSPLTFRWLFGPRADLFLFFLPPLVIGLALLLQKPIASSSLLGFLLLQGFGLGPFHNGATWFHLSNPKLKNHFFNNQRTEIKFYGIATGIIVLSIACMYVSPVLLYFVYLIWTIQHLAQQNLGILRLFHNPGTQDEAVATRKTETRSIHASAWFFALIFLLRSAEFGSFQYWFCAIAVTFAGVEFFVSLYKYACEIFSARQSSKAINVPAQLFWLLSVSILSTMAFIPKDYNQAILLPLVVHWIQYIGLNAYIIKNRHSANEENNKQLLRKESAIFILVGFAFVLLFVLLGTTLTTMPSCHYQNILFGFIYGLGLVHYFQDAWLWRFRDPVLREELLFHIKPELAR